MTSIVVKIMFFEKKGNKFSMHFHKDKDETWFVNEGSFIVRWLDTTQLRCLHIH